MKKSPSKKLSAIIEDLFNSLVSPNFVTTGKNTILYTYANNIFDKNSITYNSFYSI